MNDRARATRALLRSLGGAKRRRRKRIPQQLWPKGIQLSYIRALIGKVSAMRIHAQPLFEALPSLVASAQASQRLDSDESDRIRALMVRARANLEASLEFSTAPLELLAQEFALKTETWQRRELAKQVEAALGVDVIGTDARLPTVRDAFVGENVALIRGLPVRTYSEIEAMVIREVEAGTLYGELAKQLRERFSFAENRAKLIAQDQIGKYYGRVNRVRQQNMGLEKFIWRDSGDERVRPLHVSYNGQTYAWADAPEGGPGQPVQCRCYPEPVFDILLDD